MADSVLISVWSSDRNYKVEGKYEYWMGGTHVQGTRDSFSWSAQLDDLRTDGNDCPNILVAEAEAYAAFVNLAEEMERRSQAAYVNRY